MAFDTIRIYFICPDSKLITPYNLYEMKLHRIKPYCFIYTNTINYVPFLIDTRRPPAPLKFMVVHRFFRNESFRFESPYISAHTRQVSILIQKKQYFSTARQSLHRTYVRESNIVSVRFSHTKSTYVHFIYTHTYIYIYVYILVSSIRPD